MSCSVHGYQADHGHRMAGVQRRLFIGVLAAIMLAWVVAGFMQGASWMSVLEPLAVLAMVIGGAALIWQERTERAARTAAGHGSASHDRYASQFRVTDGGTGLSRQAADRHAQRTASGLRVHDGGAFPPQRRNA